MSEQNVQHQVQDFYDKVGWQLTSGDVYQNARYEDLRNVSKEYIQRCHLRVNRHLPNSGKYLLDAGSGPVQYPDYLTYSEAYKYRVCLDLSITALREARKKLLDHGLFVVADVTNLPFPEGVFEGAVSLHTFHHLPADDQKRAYLDLYRVLKDGAAAVVVNGWTESRLMKQLQWLISLMEWLGRSWFNLRTKRNMKAKSVLPVVVDTNKGDQGTFITKTDLPWMEQELANDVPFQIYVWRSVSVRFMRAVIHPWLGGRWMLALLYQLEEWYPNYFGRVGQYPLIVLNKPIRN